jgi:hypothetical protein
MAWGRLLLHRLVLLALELGWLLGLRLGLLLVWLLDVGLV